MRLNLMLRTLAIATLAAASEIKQRQDDTDGVCPNRRTCPDFKPLCSEAVCDGWNRFDRDGWCMAPGEYHGCPCTNVCNNSVNSCNANGCRGFNEPQQIDGTGGTGKCTEGQYKGCPCKDVCNGSTNSCSDNDCNGVNDPLTETAMCMKFDQETDDKGKYKGCPCTYTCGKNINSCSLNGCDGDPVTSRCRAGKYKGCFCILD
jgi:hypothetical protein